MLIALSAQRSSSAIALASFLCPIAAFYALTSVLLGNYYAAMLTTFFAYGFATTAMLVPAVSEFDPVS